MENLGTIDVLTKFAAITGMDRDELRGLRKALLTGGCSGVSYGNGAASAKTDPVCAIGYLMRERGHLYDCQNDHVSCAVLKLAPQTPPAEATEAFYNMEHFFYNVTRFPIDCATNLEFVDAIDELLKSNAGVL